MTESKFLTAFEEFEADKLEARRVQGEIATLNAACAPLEETIARDIAAAEAVLEKTRANGEVQRCELRDSIKITERTYERMRRRVDQKSEGLVEMLHAEIRNQ